MRIKIPAEIILGFISGIIEKAPDGCHKPVDLYYCTTARHKDRITRYMDLQGTAKPKASQAEPITIRKGSVMVHSVFDIGGEISLEQAEKYLSQDTHSSRFRLTTDTRKAIIIKEAPLTLSLGEENLRIDGSDFRVELSAKIWDYGVVSVTIRLTIPENTSWDDLVKLAVFIENSKEVDDLAIVRKENLRKKILPAVKDPTDWETYEDYITYFIEKIDGIGKPAELLSRADVSGLILAENRELLSTASKNPIIKNALQYSENDLAVIDWNSALLIEPDGQKDVADVIEFCLTHLLEMRYYDNLLEDRLGVLYDSLENRRGRKVLSNFYTRIAEESSGKYIEFSEFLGRVENSLKTVGDFYLATIFRTAAREFRFDDWRNSIARKMRTLAQISQLVQGEVNARRSHLLDIIIILIIAIEVVPAILSILRYFR